MRVAVMQQKPIWSVHWLDMFGISPGRQENLAHPFFRTL